MLGAVQGVGLRADRAWQLHQASGGRPDAGTLQAPELVFALGRPAALCCPAGLRAAPLTPIGRGEPAGQALGPCPAGRGLAQRTRRRCLPGSPAASGRYINRSGYSSLLRSARVCAILRPMRLPSHAYVPPPCHRPARRCCRHLPEPGSRAMLQHAQAGHGAGPPLGWPGSAADAQRGPVAGSPPGSLQQQQGRFAGSSPQGRDIPAPDTASASSQQTTLFPQFSPEAAADLFSSGSSAGGGGAAVHQQQQAALKQNLQKLYGSLGLQHGSRSSLPDIQEDEPQTSLPSDPPLVPPSAAGRLPPHGRAPSGRAMSDEDLFGMQDLHHAAGQQQAAAAGSAAGAGLGPPPAADLSLVGQLPAGSAQSRTLFVRNVDPAVPEDELRTLFEVGGCCAGVVLLGWGAAVCGNKRCPRTRVRCATMAVLQPAGTPRATGWPSTSACPSSCLAPSLILCSLPSLLPHLTQAFGEVRSLYTAAKARGFVVVGYFDTRAATLAQHTLSGQALGAQRLDVHFSLPKDDREASQVGRRGGDCWVVAA